MGYFFGDFFRLEQHVDSLFAALTEVIMTLKDSVDTLGALVQKVVTDGATTKRMIDDLNTKLDALVAQGSADASELAALKAQVEEAVPQIDANNALLKQLDDSVQDPGQPDLDPNTPV